MATQPSEEVPPSREGDVRALRPYLLQRGPLRTLLRRVLGSTTLAVLDTLGLALGRILHTRRRALLLGDRESNASLQRTLSGNRAGIAYEFVQSRVDGHEATLRERLERLRPDEVILN